MKRLLLITAALIALTGAASALDAETTTEKLYRLNGGTVRVWTDSEGAVEIRHIPGWQLDPNCPESKWGEDECNGGQGFLLFNGTWSKGTAAGEARLDRDGCEEWFGAFISRTGNGALRLIPDKGPAKCKAVFKPENTSPRGR